MERDDKLTRDLVHALRDLPEAEPPQGFSARVMAGLSPKRPSAWTRLRLWLAEPRHLTFTPARLIPAGLAVVALLATIWLIPGPGTAPERHLAVVRFVLDDAGRQARSVAVIGTFNDWRAKGAAMHYDLEAKAWVLEAELPPGDHEYMFEVDGRRLVPDPRAPMSRDDGFGNRNSIIFVNGSHDQAL